MHKQVSFSLFFILSVSIFLFSDAGPVPVPYYTQGKDAPWAEEKLGFGSSATIRTHGCALTAVSMVYSHFENDTLNPSRMNRWLKANSGFEDDPDRNTSLGKVVMNWPALTRYGKGYVYTRFNWRAVPADLILVRYYLDRSIPVIGEVLYRGAPHYVVLTGYDDDGFLMLDPEFPGEHRFNEVYNISDKYGSGPGRNLNGIRVLYPVRLQNIQ